MQEALAKAIRQLTHHPVEPLLGSVLREFKDPFFGYNLT
jgi:hypothetical protein